VLQKMVLKTESRALKNKKCKNPVLVDTHDHVPLWYGSCVWFALRQHNRAPLWHDRATCLVHGKSEFLSFFTFKSIPMGPKHL